MARGNARRAANHRVRARGGARRAVNHRVRRTVSRALRPGDAPRRLSLCMPPLAPRIGGRAAATLNAHRAHCALPRSAWLHAAAVIENEFGAVSIDEALVKENLKVAEEVISLDNGCACCTVRGDLMKALTQLKDRKKPDKAVKEEAQGKSDKLSGTMEVYVAN